MIIDHIIPDTPRFYRIVGTRESVYGAGVDILTSLVNLPLLIFNKIFIIIRQR